MKDQDDILLDRIKQLENENKQLKSKKSNKPFIRWLTDALEDIASAVWDAVPAILGISFALTIFAIPIASSVMRKATGNFYPVFNKSRSCVYQEVEWDEDKQVWCSEDSITPEQLAAKVQEYKSSWKKANE